MSSNEIEKRRPVCPCCQILDGANLFLPQEQAGEASADVASQQQDPKRSAEATAAPSNTVSNDLNLRQPLEAWEKLRPRSLVDTHGHAHLERESSVLYHYNPDEKSAAEPTPATSNPTIVSLSCAVEQADWESCIQYASQSPKHVAALGIHPWYLADLTDGWLLQLEELLQQHAHILVGEIGLCKQARFLRTYEHGKAAALALQRRVFLQQLELAARYQRPVSIHCVNQQGVLLEVLQQTYLNDKDGLLPPAIALHSFTGTAHHVEQLLKWEASVLQRPGQQKKDKKNDWNKNSTVQEESSTSTKQPQQPNAPPLLYFGFSHTVNYAMCSSEKSRRQGVQAIRAVPRDRLLAESDVHCSLDAPAATAGAIAYIAAALADRGETLELVADLTTRNGLAFLGRVLSK